MSGKLSTYEKKLAQFVATASQRKLREAKRKARRRAYVTALYVKAIGGETLSQKEREYLMNAADRPRLIRRTGYGLRTG